MANKEKVKKEDIVVKFSFAEFTIARESSIAALKELISETYRLPHDKQIVYRCYSDGFYRELDDDQILCHLPFGGNSDLMSLDFAICRTTDKGLESTLALHNIKTLRRVTVKTFGSGKYITSEIERCMLRFLREKIQQKTNIPSLHQTLVDADGKILSHVESKILRDLPSKSDDGDIELLLAVNQNIGKELNVLCGSLGIAQLRTVHLMFVTREERFDVLENRLRCVHDVKELADKKFQIHSWNAVVLVNGKKVSNNNASLFEFFLASPEPQNGEITLQMVAVKNPFEVFVLPYYESMSYADATKVIVTSEDTVLTLKEKLHALKPDTIDLARLSLCKYENPTVTLEDDLKTMDEYEIQPRMRLHIRDTLTIDVVRHNKFNLGVEDEKIRDFVFLKEYKDERTYGDLVKQIIKDMGYPKKTKFKLPRHCSEERKIRMDSSFEERIMVVFELT